MQGIEPAHAGISSVTFAYKASPLTTLGNPPKTGMPTTAPISQLSRDD